jgi:dolichyl-phosphate-mannose-protein mannosyltransferase
MAGGNLHSHDHTYPGSNVNQVTTYFHKDNNNHWAIQKVVEGDGEVDVLSNGDGVVLLHLETQRYLEVEDELSLVSGEKRVSCGKEPLSRAHLWRVETKGDTIKLENRVKTLTTSFRLRNVENGCYLRSTNNQYPAWGFKQGEVTCSNREDDSTLWNVERNDYVEAEDEEGTWKNAEYKDVKNLRSTFLAYVIEHNRAMYGTNKSFVQDEDLEAHRIVSQPYEWFILKRGLRMNGWDDNKPKFYMFGNPLIWYTSGMCVILAPVILLFKTIRRLREGRKIRRMRKEFFGVFLCSGGWVIHYLPFFFVKRVLYFHHYFPALFYAMFSIGYCFKHIHRYFLYLLVFSSFIHFFYFSKMTYGMAGPPSLQDHKRWIRSWDFS